MGNSQILKWPILLLCVVCAYLFLANLGARDFWAPDEGDFAEIAREVHNDPVVPHLNNKPYGEKPPLFYFLTFLGHKVLSPLKDEVSMRVPTALLALGFAVFFFVTVNTIFGRKESVLSAAILISSPLYYWQARYLQVDMAFAVFIASSMLFFFRFIYLREKISYYVFFIFTGLAFMTKGPLAIALIFPSIFIYLLWNKDFSLLKRKETYLGALVLIIIVSPWYLAIYYREGYSYLHENIIRQNLTRFFDAWSHKRPFYYYFTTLPLDFFPWSLFLPMGIYLAFRRVKEDPGISFFLIWFVWTFLFLSLSSGKISKYMLPLLPAISVLTSLVFTAEQSRYRTVILSLLVLVFFSLGWILFLYKTGDYSQFYPERFSIGCLSLAVSLVLALCLWRKRPYHAFTAMFLFILLIYSMANLSIYKKWNPYKSPRQTAEKIKPYIKDGTPWIYYGSMRGTYVYYVGTFALHVDEHNVKGLEELGKKLDSFYVLTRKRDMKEVLDTLPGARPVFEEKIGDTAMVFTRYERRKSW